MLLVDSIQAGIRGRERFPLLTTMDLQIVMRLTWTWSKAMNAGQYPLSVLGMNKRASELYVTGIYGNTMTTSPRALETAVAVLDSITPALRTNIRERGKEFVENSPNFRRNSHVITKVQGTGLLCSAELNRINSRGGG